MKSVSKILFLLILFLFFISFSVQRFQWKIRTDPYRSYLFPGEVGMIFNLNYNYGKESKSLKKFLNSEYDVKASPSIEAIYRDISTGVYFERYLNIKVKYLKSTDTLILKIHYESGDSTAEKIYDPNHTADLSVHLTKYKFQHDFSTGNVKSGTAKGMVTKVNLFVRPRKNAKKNDHVTVFSSLYTYADMPGVVSRLHGDKILRK